MPFPPLDAWDDATLDDVCASDETAILEMKAAEKFDPKKQDCTKEIAKQVSAFANTGSGILVFGVDKDGKLDDGVPEKVGREPVKAWVEALVPKLVEPAAVGVRAKFLHRPGHHQAGFGVLAIEMPLSDARPHWVRGSPDVAYLRVGEHSYPMPARTLLDMASRQGAAVVDVYEVAFQIDERGIAAEGFSGSLGWRLVIKPLVGLVSGPVCREWGLEVYLSPDAGFKFRKQDNATISEPDGTFFVEGRSPLFPGQRARVEVTLTGSNHPAGFPVRVTLYAGSARSVSREVTVKPG